MTNYDSKFLKKYEKEKNRSILVLYIFILLKKINKFFQKIYVWNVLKNNFCKILKIFSYLPKNGF